MQRLLASWVGVTSWAIVTVAQAAPGGNPAPRGDAPAARSTAGNDAPRSAAGNDAAKGEPAEEAPRELAIVAAPVLPVGDAADGVGFGLGGTVDFGWKLGEHAAFVGRAGYIHHLARSGGGATLGALPLWAGARYLFRGREGAYLEGTLGPTILFASVRTDFGTASASETRVGLAFGGGYRFSRVDVGGRFVTYDLGNMGDALGVMATVGLPFVAF